MTPLPKRRLSHKRQGKRRSSINLKLPSVGKCLKCGKGKKSHIACSYCGFYK